MRSLMHAGTRFYAMVRRETASCAHVEPNCSSGTATNHVRHVHLVNMVGVRVPSGDSGPPHTLEVAVPCALQVGSGALCLGSHCELVTCPAMAMMAPCGLLQHQFTVSNAQSASLAYLRARQLQCAVQQPSNILNPPPIGRLMKLLRLATGTLGTQQDPPVSWYV